MNQFEQNLEKYAELVVRVGVNVQPGQTLVINTPILAVDFVRKVAQKAYDVGAKNVHVEWSDEQVTRIKYESAPDEAFLEYPVWRAKGFEQMAAAGAAFLYIDASNPDLLKGINSDRIAAARKASSTAMKTFNDCTSTNKVSWSVVAIPTLEWAKKVFPNAGDEEAVTKLWEAIFMATRIDQEDPVAAWHQHTKNLARYVGYLNAKRYKKLHYKANGTDLTIELPENHLWIGGDGYSEQGVEFIANMPTEEVFTTPLKTGVHGVVHSTKPLNYAGQVIDNFSLTFEGGKIVDFHAETGYETLKNLIETDDGAHYLGEVALVPDDSPISNLNVVFSNTLFDENASCHLAIGNAYAFCIEGGTTMTKAELEQCGANESLTHVDFMIGSNDMNIDGETADGTVEPVFRSGNWVI
jgi:aminopeptidase